MGTPERVVRMYYKEYEVATHKYKIPLVSLRGERKGYLFWLVGTTQIDRFEPFFNSVKGLCQTGQTPNWTAGNEWHAPAGRGIAGSQPHSGATL
jgi:hypothetical protein